MITIEELLIVVLSSNESLFFQQVNLIQALSLQNHKNWKAATNIFKIVVSITQSQEHLAAFGQQVLEFTQRLIENAEEDEKEPIFEEYLMPVTAMFLIKHESL